MVRKKVKMVFHFHFESENGTKKSENGMKKSEKGKWKVKMVFNVFAQKVV